MHNTAFFNHRITTPFFFCVKYITQRTLYFHLLEKDEIHFILLGSFFQQKTDSGLVTNCLLTRLYIPPKEKTVHRGQFRHWRRLKGRRQIFRHLLLLYLFPSQVRKFLAIFSGHYIWKHPAAKWLLVNMQISFEMIMFNRCHIPKEKKNTSYS